MLRVGDVIKHKNITFNNTSDPLLGIVENIGDICHVRACDHIYFDEGSSVRVMTHKKYTYVGQEHLEQYWRLVC